MLKIYGFNSQNNKKVLYVAEELNLPYEFIKINLMERENKTESFLKMNPAGKVPVIDDDGKYLFESAAICRYLAESTNSSLFPQDQYKKALVDQWMSFLSNHVGRWLNTLYFEKILKPLLNIGEANLKKCDEAQKFLSPQLQIIENELIKKQYIASDELSIADFFAYAYIEQMEPLEMTFEDFPKILEWKTKISKRDSISKAQKNFN